MTDRPRKSMFNRTDPRQGAYNGFSLKDRQDAAGWARSVAPPVRRRHPTWCHACGNTEGQVYWHNEDYRTPLASLPLCPWCHWTLHDRLKSPEGLAVFQAWRERLAEGWRPPYVSFGTRWPTWRATFKNCHPRDWPSRQYDLFGSAEETAPLPARHLFDLVSLEPEPFVRPSLALLAGAEPLEGQWTGPGHLTPYKPLEGRQ